MSVGAPVACPPTGDLLHWMRAWMSLATAPEQDTATSSSDLDFRDREAMARLAGGDTQALRPLFDRWKLPLLSYFYRALGSRADAEDLALQTFERVFRAAQRYRPEAKFSTWLFAIARGELLHELRRRRRKPVVAVPPEDLAGQPAPATGAAETEEILLAALQQLPERERSAVLLTAGGDLGSPEIARVLGLSVGHLHVVLHRARSVLRARFNQLNA